jgi:hypothetical protein
MTSTIPASQVTQASTVDTGSGSYIPPQTPCTAEGMWNCINDTSTQRCASGRWSAVQLLAAGMSCVGGQATIIELEESKWGSDLLDTMIESACLILLANTWNYTICWKLKFYLAKLRFFQAYSNSGLFHVISSSCMLVASRTRSQRRSRVTRVPWGRLREAEFAWPSPSMLETLSAKPITEYPPITTCNKNWPLLPTRRLALFG